MKSNEIKEIIIENFIEWYSSFETERIRMKEALQIYLDEDHVDEVQEFINQMTK
jgi:hypothetical protein